MTGGAVPADKFKSERLPAFWRHVTNQCFAKKGTGAGWPRSLLMIRGENLVAVSEHNEDL
jgi:hypothetical protein